jgi:hypothetical protein
MTSDEYKHREWEILRWQRCRELLTAKTLLGYRAYGFNQTQFMKGMMYVDLTIHSNLTAAVLNLNWTRPMLKISHD